jgi:hypothetical protein
MESPSTLIESCITQSILASGNFKGNLVVSKLKKRTNIESKDGEMWSVAHFFYTINFVNESCSEGNFVP